MGCPRDSDDSGTSSVPSEARCRPPSDRPPPRTAQCPTAQCRVLLYVKCRWGGDPCSYQLPAAVRIRLVSTVSHSFPSRLHFRRLSFMPPTAVTSFSTSMYIEGSELTWGREANRTFSAAVASDVGHGQREGHARVEQSCQPTAGWGWGWSQGRTGGQRSQCAAPRAGQVPGAGVHLVLCAVEQRIGVTAKDLEASGSHHLLSQGRMQRRQATGQENTAQKDPSPLGGTWVS